MTDRTPQQINADLDKLLKQVGSPPDNDNLSTDIARLRQQVVTRDGKSVSAEVMSLKTSVDKLKSPSWFKDQRKTGSWVSATIAAVSFSIGAGLTPFKVDEKGITIFGVTREMPWKKLVDLLQKKLPLANSKDQKDKRILDEKLKDVPENLTKLTEKVEENKTNLQAEITTKVDAKFNPLNLRVEKIETVLKTARTNVARARADMDRVSQDPDHKGIDRAPGQKGSPRNDAIAEDVRNLRTAVDELTTALGTLA